MNPIRRSAGSLCGSSRGWQYDCNCPVWHFDKINSGCPDPDGPRAKGERLTWDPQ